MNVMTYAPKHLWKRGAGCGRSGAVCGSCGPVAGEGVGVSAWVCFAWVWVRYLNSAMKIRCERIAYLRASRSRCVFSGPSVG